MEPITLENFATLVRQMRDAQKDYFKYRNPSALKKRVQLEGKVDEMITKIAFPKQQHPTQEKLF